MQTREQREAIASLTRRIRMMKAFVDAADAIDRNTLGIVAHQCYDEVCTKLYHVDDNARDANLFGV